VLLRARVLQGARLPAPPSLVERTSRGETVIETTEWQAGEPIRLLTIPIRVSSGYPYAVQVGTSLRPTYAFLRSARLAWLVMSIVLLAAVTATGAVLTRNALRPVSNALEMARQIGEAIGGRRLPDPRTDDEIGRLVATLNAMLERLERSMDVHRRFTADAAHELRTPLSRLRSEIEIALRRPRSTAEYLQVLQSSLEETVRLTALVDALLTLARLDSDAPATRCETAYAETADALATACERLQDEASRRRVQVAREPSPSLAVRIPPDLLSLLVGNLLQNAIKFSQEGGRVVVGVAEAPGEAVVSITDNGPGVPPEQRPKIFDRFYRGEAARSGDIPGVGLGLSICRVIAERYHGRIEMTPNPAGGSIFSARLPLAAGHDRRVSA